MKTFIKIGIICATLLTATACTSTTNMERYKTLTTDTAVLCGGSLKGIVYKDELYSTTIKCDGKTFIFAKKQDKGVIGAINVLTK